MAVHFNEFEPIDLSGLDAVIRLKADLLHKLGTLPQARWTAQVIGFVSALERSELRDRTALIVLLAEIWEEIRLRVGVGDRASAADVTGVERLTLKAWTQLPIITILAQFQEAVVRVLLPTAPGISLSAVVHQAKSIIDERYAEPLTLKDLAAAVRRSKRHLGAVFAQEVGVTVHQYLTRVRMRHALELIRAGEKIEVVSLLVGYRSKANFYRHFNAQVGMAPRAYRAALFHLTGRR